MGIVLEFKSPPFSAAGAQSAPVPENRLRDAYRRDLQRALGLITDAVLTDEYDGLIAMLRPRASSTAPVIAVAGLYRHQIQEAANASIFLHQTIKKHARARGDREGQHAHSADSSTEREGSAMQDEIKIALWREATARYHQCERLLRVAFTQQLRASPETTQLLMRVTQLSIETVADVLWELVRLPGHATAHARMEVLNAIQDFRAARRQVAAWMPPLGQEDAYFEQHAPFLTEGMIAGGLEELERAGAALRMLVGEAGVQLANIK